MRICIKHFKEATEILQSSKTGEEFDLCPDCEMELREILYAKPKIEPVSQQERDIEPRRHPGRPKRKTA